MDDIRSWWEVPCIAHFCHSFKKPFHLPEFDIEELEDAILLDHAPGTEDTPTSPAPLLVELYTCFLNGIVDKTITEDNWAFFLKLHLEWRCEYLGERWNPLKGDQEYRSLRARDKVEILHRLCHWRLELDDIGDLLRGMDGPSLRVESLGKDADGFSYWYFYGTRLYKEAPRRRKKKKPEAPAAKKTDVATPGKRGKGKGGTPGGRGPTPGRKKKVEEKEEAKKSLARRKKEEDGEEAEGRAPSHSPRKAQGNRSLRSRGSRGKKKEEEEGSEGEEEEGESSPQAGGKKRTPNRRKKPIELPADDSQEDSGVEDGAEEDSLPEEGRGAEPRRSGRRSRKQEEEEESGGESNGGSEGVSNGKAESDSDSEPKEDSERKEEGPEKKISSTGWEIACSTTEEWEELVASLEGTKGAEPRRLLRSLELLLPDVLWLLQQQDRDFKKKLLAEMPRRTSDRIALKAAQKEEQERLEALEREFQREELRKHLAEEQRVREEEAEQKRQRRREDALQKRKVREEEQKRQRIEEEENWSRALSGELSGPRKAAELVTESQQMTEHAWELLAVERDTDLYTAMFKILAGLRKLEDSWVFEDPVTEAIAPGYFEIVDKPMDYVTVEKKLEASEYHTKEEFMQDIEQIFTNCSDYNGSDSEYTELAEDSKKAFHKLAKKHFTGEEEEAASKKRGRRRESRSPSACKTPELTSESSSEESDSGSDESYEGSQKKPKKHTIKPLIEGQKLTLPRHPFPLPQPNPHLYQQYLRQQYGMRPPLPPEMGYRPPYGRMPPPYPPQGMRLPPDSPSMYPPYPHPNHYPNAQMGHFRHPGPPHMPPHMMQHPAFMRRQQSGNPAPKGPHGMPQGPHGIPPHSMPPGSHGMPPGSHGMPPGSHGMPPGTYGVPPGMPPGPHSLPQGPHGMPPTMPLRQHHVPHGPHTAAPGAEEQRRVSPMSDSQSNSPLAQRLTDSPLAQRLSMSPLAQRQPSSPALPNSPTPARQPSSPSLKRQSSSPALVQQPNSPSLKRQSSSPALARQPSSPSLKQPSSSPALEEGGPGRKAEEGEEKAAQEGSEREKEGDTPTGYGAPPNAYDMGRQAAYRYHQMMAGPHHLQDPYAHYHGYGHPPPYPHSQHHPAHPPPHPQAQPHSREEAYYAWQQQMAHYHHSAQHHPAHPSHPGHSEAAARQRYWQEMEMRRRYAMMHQQKHHHGNIQHPQKERGTSSGGNIPDYQDSLQKDALGLGSTSEVGEEQAAKTAKTSEEEGDTTTTEKVDSDSAPNETAEDKELRSGTEHHTADEHRGQSSAGEQEGASQSSEQKTISGQVDTEKPDATNGPSDSDKSSEPSAGVSKQSSVSKASEQPSSNNPEVESKSSTSKGSSPEKAGVLPRAPLPPYSHHPPPYPMGPQFQNGYPSEAELAQMHPYYHPPPHMMPPEMYPPQPFAPRHFEAEKHNGATTHMNPNYAGYYGNRMPYYPPPYMHSAEHSGLTPQQMERWRAEMKQHQAMHGYPYPPHPPPHYPPMPTGDTPSHHHKHPLLPPTSTEDSGEPPAKKQRTSDS